MDCICAFSKCHSSHTIILRYDNISLVTNTDQLIIDCISTGSNHYHFTVI